LQLIISKSHNKCIEWMVFAVFSLPLMQPLAGVEESRTPQVEGRQRGLNNKVPIATQ
jgi:hypothetical protein